MSFFPEPERAARLRLIRTEGIGPVSFARLIERDGNACRALARLESEGHATASVALVEQELARTGNCGAQHIFLGESAYPPLLASISDPPPVIVARGNMDLAAVRTVGIVGARNASAAGQKLAHQIAEILGEAGFVIVSGLARGIDGAAHRGALRSGTIACVAGGVDIAYPPEHARLQDEIAEKGLLLSEMPCGVEPVARHFPRRNRLIASLGEGLLVVEATPGSGSLITARIATEVGREVMAVPGHPSDPRARGCNGLIRDGAVLVESADDVIAALSPFALAAPPPRAAKGRPSPVRPVTSTARQHVDVAQEPASGDPFLELLSTVPVHVDELVRGSGLSASEVGQRLVMLEIEGRLVRHAGGRVALDGAAAAV